MEINYKLIIKYLVKKNSLTDITNKSKSNSFITQKNILTYSKNCPEKFKNLVTDKFYRYGITVYDHENNNVSFWASILSILDKNFMIPYSSDELELISQFKLQLVEKYNKSNISSFLKNLDKNDLRERFKLEPDIYTIQYIIDILNINILVFDFQNQEIYSGFHKDIMNPWKKTLLLAKFKNYWEPIMMVKVKGETEKLFDYNNTVIKKILTTNDLVKYFEGDKINKEHIINEDIYEIIQQEKLKLNIKDNKQETKELINKELIEDDSEFSDSSVKTNDTDLFVKEDDIEEYKKLNKTKLTKMKLDELHIIVEKLKIVVTKKNPTKSILIESILNYYL